MSKNPCLLFSLVFLSVAQRVMRVNKYIRQNLTFFLFGPRIGIKSFAITLIFFLLQLFGHQERAVLLLQLRPLQRGLFGENRSLHSSQSRPSPPSHCQHPMTPYDHFVQSRRTTRIFKNNIATLSRLRLNSQLDWSNCVSRKTRS